MSILLLIIILSGILLSILNAIKAKYLPNSISSFSYISGNLLFTCWVIVIAIALLYPTSKVLPTNLSWLALLQSVSLFLVAASPDYKKELTIIHFIGGYLFGIISQVIVYMLFPYALVGWILFLIPIFVKPLRSNKTIIAEYICMITLVISLFTKL